MDKKPLAMMSVNELKEYSDICSKRYSYWRERQEYVDYLIDKLIKLEDK